MLLHTDGPGRKNGGYKMLVNKRLIALRLHENGIGVMSKNATFNGYAALQEHGKNPGPLDRIVNDSVLVGSMGHHV